MKSRLLLLTITLAAGLSLTGRAGAQTPAPTIVPIALAPLARDAPVELVALTLDADISEANGRTLVTGNSTFKLHNPDKLNDLQVPVGFPAWAGDPYAFDPARLGTFSVSVDGKKVTNLATARAELKIGSTVRTVDWYTFTLSLAADTKHTVRFDFQQDLGDGAMPRFTYGFLPANAWKGPVGSARLTLRLPEVTTREQVVAYDPPNPAFDGQSWTWRFEATEPPANPTLVFLRPSLWSDLVAKRRAAQQTPHDANARAALGAVLRQLALVDSPRRESFYGQAVAELQAALRLDANQRAARQSLAGLYEARAGPATGPRRAEYVLLAVAQWETLAANDATARKQLAEDYFYLGLDAQTRQAYAEASAYYDKAYTLAPNGAGPLFVPDRAAAQRRALNIAWARALLDQNDAPNAALRARAALGDPFIEAAPPPAFYVARAQVTTTTEARTMTFTLVPYADTLEAVNRTVETLRAAGGNASFDASAHRLTILTPPGDWGELTALQRALPDGIEWALVRAVAAPDALTWDESDGMFSRTLRYQEHVNLSAACAAFQTQLDTLASALAPLNETSVAAMDAETQLKRAWLQFAQQGWQAALASGQVTYRVGAAETRVAPCATRTLVLAPLTWKMERVAAVLLAAVAAEIGVLALWWRVRRK